MIISSEDNSSEELSDQPPKKPSKFPVKQIAIPKKPAKKDKKEHYFPAQKTVLPPVDSPLHGLSAFGPQPGASVTGGLLYHATPPKPAIRSPTKSPALQNFPRFETPISVNQVSVSEKAATTKLLLLIALCYKKNDISDSEKGNLKDLVISGNPLVFSALDVFEIDQDLEELVDTLKRICKLVFA